MRTTEELVVTVRSVHAPRGSAVVVPGFLDGATAPGTEAVARALATSGYTALTFDPRGSGPGSGAAGELGPTTQLADIAGLLDLVPSDRVALVGHCYGALLATLAAAIDPRVTDVVALMPTRCFIWPEDYDRRKDTWRGDGERRFVRGGGEVVVPYSVVEDALAHDLPAALRTLRQRILFVAGDRDEVIPVHAVRRLHDECGSPEREMIVLPVQHDYRDHPDQIEIVNRAVLDWLTAGRREHRSRCADGPQQRERSSRG